MDHELDHGPPGVHSTILKRGAPRPALVSGSSTVRNGPHKPSDSSFHCDQRTRIHWFNNLENRSNHHTIALLLQHAVCLRGMGDLERGRSDPDAPSGTGWHLSFSRVFRPMYSPYHPLCSQTGGRTPCVCPPDNLTTAAHPHRPSMAVHAGALLNAPQGGAFPLPAVGRHVSFFVRFVCRCSIASRAKEPRFNAVITLGQRKTSVRSGSA